MSRFADPRATLEVDLGPCECPGAPHDRDVAVIRSQYSEMDAAWLRNSVADLDSAAEAWARFIVSWNLLGPNGEDFPASPAAFASLHTATFEQIAMAIGKAARESNTVPNRSGAPSVASPRRSASPTPTPIPTPGT